MRSSEGVHYDTPPDTQYISIMKSVYACVCHDDRQYDHICRPLGWLDNDILIIYNNVYDSMGW